MSFIQRLPSLSFVALGLHLAVAQGQTCYYPDGLTVSTDVVCNSAANFSSCCPSSDFCLEGGLCFGSGIISRGSCTDQSWDSPECATYCTNSSQTSSISLTPCDADTNTFVCGLNNTHCHTDEDTFTIPSGTSIVLRESQLQTLVINSELSEGNAKRYTGGAMAGLAAGLALPLLLALVVALYLLRQEKNRNRPKLMYKPADEPAVQLSVLPPKESLALSRNPSTNTFNSTAKPYYQNYQYRNPFASESDHGVPVYEIDSSSPPYSERDRVEAPDKRFSK